MIRTVRITIIQNSYTPCITVMRVCHHQIVTWTVTSWLERFDFEYNSGIHAPMANTRINVFTLDFSLINIILQLFHIISSSWGVVCPWSGGTLSYLRTSNFRASSFIRNLADYIVRKLIKFAETQTEAIMELKLNAQFHDECPPCHGVWNIITAL
jgi:hypothetical protein